MHTLIDLKIFTEINRDALEDNNSNFRNMLELLGKYNFKFYISNKKESEWRKIEICNFEELMKNDSVMNVLCKKN